MDGLSRMPTLFDVENNPIGLLINFSQFLKFKIKAKEISQCNLTGRSTRHSLFNHCNIVKCRAEHWSAKSTDLNSVDIKDCYIQNCIFENTILNNNAIINSICRYSIFKNCSFNFSSITGTTFENVIFEKCDLCNLVMEGCRFMNCSFIECKTSNKLIEQSLMFNTKFQSMEIELDTILENFGLSKSDVIDILILNRKSHIEEFKSISNEKLETLLLNNAYSKLDKFKISYYLNDQVLTIGNEHIDNIFEARPWLEVCKNHATFNNLLTLFYEFLSYNYEHNRIMLWPLLKLYLLTSHLAQGLHTNTVSIYPTIMGIHMSVVRYVEEYYALTQEFTKKHISNPVVLLVCAGPIDKEFYRNRLSPIFNNYKDVEIFKVIKHNSPNELYLNLTNILGDIYAIPWKDLVEIASGLIAIYSFFFMTRTKTHIESIKDSILSELSGKITKKIPSNTTKTKRKKANAEEKNFKIAIMKTSDTLDDTTKIQIVYPQKNTLESPILIEIQQSSHVICTIGDTVIDILS